MNVLFVLSATVTLAGSHQRIVADTIPVVAASATIIGVITDSLGRSIVGADVLVDGIRMAPSDDFGSFVVSVTAKRRHVIHLRALGYIPGQFSILIDSGETRTAEIVLQSVATLLPGVTITVHQDDVDRYSPGLAGFAHRRETLGGSFLDAQEIKAYGYPPLSMLLRRMPGVTVSSSVVNGMTHSSVQMRGNPTVSTSCPPQVYLDGHPMSLPGGADNVDGYINTHELAAVEVYPSTAWVPAQFMGPTTACGTIVLWTPEALTR